jgi:hypothetical protein
MGLPVCPSYLYCTALSKPYVQNKANKGNQPEGRFAALAQRALRTSAYIQSTLKQLYIEINITALKPFLE